jgi:hypothetical protein
MHRREPVPGKTPAKERIEGKTAANVVPGIPSVDGNLSGVQGAVLIACPEKMVVGEQDAPDTRE